MSLLLEHYSAFATPEPGRNAHPDEIAYLPARSENRRPQVDIVIPVYNEAHTVSASVQRLHAFLSASLPTTFRITIADNASIDGTWEVACGLRGELTDVCAVRLSKKGRGRALQACWAASNSDVLVYMDVDLSTDLAALLPLIAPLLTGHSDLSIGSRLAKGSRIVRGRKRDLISRCYNALLRATLRARFSDAQCGFKAITRDAAAQLLPLVEDTAWFFDTELLVLAERAGLRIYEVPVDWVDDEDSRVDIVDTAWKDLQGVMRMRSSLSSQRGELTAIGSRLGRGPLTTGCTNGRNSPAA